MFPQNNADYTASQQSQLSPIRRIQLSDNGEAPTQISSIRRNTRPMQSFGPMAPMATFIQGRNYGGQNVNSLNNFHSVFDDDTIPPLLDLSEFPSLTDARRNKSNALQPPGSKPYVGMVKPPTAEQSEFRMCNEDFPPLPGAEITDGALSSNSLRKHEVAYTDTAGAAGVDLQTESISVIDKAFKRGVQTSPDGKVTNIPASMVNNEFGMVGLLTFIRAAESDPNLITLGMGQDLTGLGLNVNSQEYLHPTFGGPFSSQPCRPQDIDFHVPPEYLVNMAITKMLPNLVLKKYKDDLLFFLFYQNIGDCMQLETATELFSRDWRFHIKEKVWIKRIPDFHNENNGKIERGTFNYFDAQNWRLVPLDFDIDPSKLEKCPNLSAIVCSTGQPM